ncbi:MAG TPA: bifunctional 3-(3-hydroxy-phenyl)propionate/3-hydroxycinnamic acid hydroxylase [Beijerinckiaceae bacterium]|jgi:3-(3-hydroxy-phenyl)propionate hydroxylase
MNERECDVAIVGAGPTGLTLCNLLGLAGLRVVLIERNATTVQEPRAVSIDDEALRTMQSAGLIEEVLKDVALDYGSHYFTAEGACFAKVEPKTREFGYPRRSAFTQPKLEAVLREGLSRFANVTTLFGHSCESVRETADGVVVAARPADGPDVIVRATYLVGADGARSTIRRVIGAEMVGSTYQQRWLIVDLASTKEQFRQTRVVCNPKRPMITLPGPHGIRRYEFMLRGDETDAVATAPDFVRELLAAHGPDADAPVVRRQVYTFHARIANRWHSNRVFLAGDAAHLSPPFAGQGMNSGIRDAHNLAWKLAAVVQGRLGPGVLATYERERSPHAWALIKLAVNMGRVMMPTSRWQARAVQSAFQATRVVPPVQAYFAQMKYKPKPFYREGFLVEGDARGLVGRMIAQPLVEVRWHLCVRLDDLIGNAFGLVAVGGNAQRILDRARATELNLANIRPVAVLPSRFNPDPKGPSDILAGRDVDDVLAGAVGNGGDMLLLVRPDRYVAAAARIEDVAQISAFAVAANQLVDGTWAGTLRPALT